MMATTKPFQLGSISTGTLRAANLVPVFESAIFAINPHAQLKASFDNICERLTYLKQELQELCPPFVYFGAHPGDGADFGFWPDWDNMYEALENLPEHQSEYKLTHCIVRLENGKATVMDLNRKILWST